MATDTDGIRAASSQLELCLYTKREVGQGGEPGQNLHGRRTGEYFGARAANARARRKPNPRPSSRELDAGIHVMMGTRTTATLSTAWCWPPRP
ncbi:hypothetical protein DCS_00633 [Drechmeria coniospora]|uniref:Uncharacterized protein n=1 Tax=Drechmeria coniospora TaxID=98403 RepID=A0A151GQY4_DRECN|nr:hypothetical protein DCS_00633 [Drechmeria coniospora]KYK59503.1 hypothetical protein DCS_00633 [Drechmeria coniospora]